MKFRLAWLALPALVLSFVSAEAKTVCTMIAGEDGEIVLRDGDCGTQVTPASTFKIPLSLMGFDSGFLTDEHSPTLPFREGYPDWAGEAWQQPTDPARWMKYSVVWFSQQITREFGEDRLQAYVDAFGYGNADLSGDPGKDNGLERSWIGSSLKISPEEQVGFLRRFLTGELPVSDRAVDMTRRIIETTPLADGWEAHGKTGGAFPWGWFVG